jgi:hypothetical protein
MAWSFWALLFAVSLCAASVFVALMFSARVAALETELISAAREIQALQAQVTALAKGRAPARPSASQTGTARKRGRPRKVPQSAAPEERPASSSALDSQQDAFGLPEKDQSSANPTMGTDPRTGFA